MRESLKIRFYSTQKEVIYIIFYANFILGRKLENGKAIGGKGRLTLTRIDIMQSFYGLAIRKNKGDPEAMARSTRAILKHYSEDVSHDDCPIGKDSWCSFQRDKTTGQNSHKAIKDPLPKAVMDVMQPLFSRLGSVEFLSACKHCRTQNVNESYHNVVWSMAPKSCYVSSAETKLAFELATLLFNKGHQRCLQDVCGEIGVTAHENMKNQWNLTDIEKQSNKSRQKGETFKQRRKKLKRKFVKTNDAFVHKEGVHYQSGAFHAGGTSKTNNSIK